ncbi:MAG: hypothetical protein ACFWT6_11885 [Virgibacillus proomii]|jgi:hypothetical protein
MKVPIRIYNRFLDLKSEIDSYQSLQYGRSYHGVASFELHINRYMHEAQKINKGDIIALDKQANKAGIILTKEIVLDEKGRESENFKLTGYTLDGLMSRRITVPPSHTGYDRKSGNAETVMKHYVYNHFINPASRSRIMPHLEVAPNYNRGDYIEWESRLKNVAEELENISIKSGLGWGIFANFKTKKLIFDVIEAKDLTQDNPFGNNPVFFSPEFETIKSQSFIDSDNDLKTVGYVGGQGEGVERKIVTIGNKTGWDRIEIFIDARDVGTEDEESEKELTDEEIEQQLIERGKSKMAEMENIRSLEAEILTPVKDITPFQYEKDFDLGDIVQVVNKSWGLEMTAPITEFKEIHEPGGFRLEATFGRSVPLFTDKIKREFDELNGVEKQELPAQIAVETKRYTDHKVSKEEQERIKQSEENLKASKEFTEKYAEKKRVKSPTEPVDKDVIWIDTSNPDNEVWKVWKESEGAWSPLYDNVQVGGRNLLRESDVYSESQSKKFTIYPDYTDAFNSANEITLSVDLEYVNAQVRDNSSNRIGFEISVKQPDGSNNFYGVWKRVEQGETFKGRISKTYTIKNDIVKVNSIGIYVQMTADKHVIGRPKWEKGNKATDWTPAPEDQEAYAEYIAQLKADLAEEEAKAHADGKVTEEEQARINDVKEKLEQAKQHANKVSQEKAEEARKQAEAFSKNASNISEGIFDVGSVPIRTAANGARIQWDGTNGFVQYDSNGNPVSWLDLKGNSRFVNTYLSGEIHAKRGVLGDGNVIIDDQGVKIVRPDGAIAMQNGLMNNAYAVSADDPYYMTTTKNEVPGAEVGPVFIPGGLYGYKFRARSWYVCLKYSADGSMRKDTGYLDVRDGLNAVAFQRYEFVHCARYLIFHYWPHADSGKHSLHVVNGSSDKKEDRIYFQLIEKGTSGIQKCVIDLGKPTFKKRDVTFKIGWVAAWTPSPDEEIIFRMKSVIQTDVL